MKQHLLRSAVAAATCSVLVLTLAPPAHALPGTGSLAGFIQTDVGWVPAAPDTGQTACQPKLHADTYRPDFNHLTITPTWMSMDVTAYATAYVAKWECGSRAVMGAFRMTDQWLAGRKTTGWKHVPGEDVTDADLYLLAERQVVRDEPTFTGVILIEAGAWWGKPNAAGQMVYYPAGCVQQSWLYTIAAATGAVEAQPLGGEMPCVQPPLPGTPEIL